ncbi:MAG: S8 family serine peptidase [Deltaproteobacteria bacterium]|nr:S8 family serine peptidase [Deltaproteobacteria bacterium]
MANRHLTLGLLLALAACGGEPTETTTTTPPPATTGETATEPASPWDALSGAALRTYVRDGAMARLAEVQPEVTAEALDRWLESPDDAPPLKGRTVERLFDLGAVALAAGDLDRAEKIVRLVRARAKNRNSAFAGNTILAEIARRRRSGDDARRGAIVAVFQELPRTRFGSATVIFQIFQAPEQLAANLGQIHQQLVSLETASDALYFEQILPSIVEHRALFLSAIEQVRAIHEAGDELEEYAFGTVDLAGARDAQEVVIGVWDVGTNPELFSEQLYSNPNEQPNGEDDDDNGQVDDIHGIASDIGEFTNADLLYRPDDAVLAEYKPFLRGIMDLRAGMASTEAAQRVLTLMRSADSPEALEHLDINLDAIGEWAHGTHVAGIMLAGIPQAKLAIFRSAWAGEARLYHHRGPTDEELEAERANALAVAAFAKANNVRVINASLGFATEYVAGQLRHEGEVYENDEQVMERARAVQAHRAETWRQAIAAAPETLFVVAAGNSNQDVVEYAPVPASLQAPNLLTIGAVDRYGQWATFTNSNTERVKVFDFGVEVPSLVPDGETVPLSGTSMASPNAANLAAKLIALNPELTPAQVITIIQETADPIAEPFEGAIANEVKAVERVRSERPRRGRRRGR